MKRWRRIFFAACMGVMALGAAQRLLGQQTGTLTIDLKNYTSDVKIPKKIQKQLEHPGVQWGVHDHTLLFLDVNPRYVNVVDPLYQTRFGEQKTLEMKAGEYIVTCVAHDFNSDSMSVDKFLSKNAFFNIDVLKFEVSPGKTTTLEIAPIYVAKSVWFRLSKVTMYDPDLKMRVLEDGTQRGEDVVINRRTDKSVAWDDYKGPLKF